jgi:transcriptional regulator with XRE-family HTH domain
MTQVVELSSVSGKRDIRVARASFIRGLIEDDDRSVRYVAQRMGVAPSTLGERLSGKTAFLADDIAAIAEVLRRNPIELYGQYLDVGLGGFEPPTPTVKSVRLNAVETLAIVTPIRAA